MYRKLKGCNRQIALLHCSFLISASKVDVVGQVTDFKIQFLVLYCSIEKRRGRNKQKSGVFLVILRHAYFEDWKIFRIRRLCTLIKFLLIIVLAASIQYS